MASIHELGIRARRTSTDAHSNGKRNTPVNRRPLPKRVQGTGKQCRYCFDYGHDVEDCVEKKGDETIRLRGLTLVDPKINQLPDLVGELQVRIDEMQDQLDTLLAWVEAKDKENKDTPNRKRRRRNHATAGADQDESETK